MRQCLYFHYDGVRYCFKRDPNVTLLVEQEADAVARDESRVRARIKAMIEERLAGRRSAIVWPAKSADVPDREAQFLIAYLPLEFTARTTAEQREAMKDICENHGNRVREFRNGLGLAVPSSDQVEVLRRAVRYLLAVERVRDKWREHNLTDTQKSQLKEREATERAAAESALLKLYGEIRLPETDGGSPSLDTTGMGAGRSSHAAVACAGKCSKGARSWSSGRPPYQDDFAVAASADACSASRIGVLPFRVPGTVPPAAVLPGFRLR